MRKGILGFITFWLTLQASFSLAETKHPIQNMKVLTIFSYLPGIWSSEAERGIRVAFRERRIELELSTYTYDYIRQRKNIKKEIGKLQSNHCVIRV